jgi:hypothetical protein
MKLPSVASSFLVLLLVNIASIVATVAADAVQDENKVLSTPRDIDSGHDAALPGRSVAECNISALPFNNEACSINEIRLTGPFGAHLAAYSMHTFYDAYLILVIFMSGSYGSIPDFTVESFPGAGIPCDTVSDPPNVHCDANDSQDDSTCNTSSGDVQWVSVKLTGIFPNDDNTIVSVDNTGICMPAACNAQDVLSFVSSGLYQFQLK